MKNYDSFTFYGKTFKFSYFPLVDVFFRIITSNLVSIKYYNTMIPNRELKPNCPLNESFLCVYGNANQGRISTKLFDDKS